MHLKTASKFRLQIHASGSFPPSYVPSPGPARTAALRPQFALEASKCDFLAFQKSFHFLLPFFLEKIAKIDDFGLPKPSQNPFKIHSKSRSQKTCDFSSIFVQFFSFFWCSISWKSWFSYKKITIFKVFTKSVLLQILCSFWPKKPTKNPSKTTSEPF